MPSIEGARPARSGAAESGADARVNGDEAEPGRLRLVIIGESGVVMHALPEAGELTIGSAALCDVRIEDPSVSPRHARLFIQPGAALAVVDLQSEGGTRVRELLLAPGEPTEVAPGDLLQLGNALIMVEKRGTSSPRRLLTHDYFELRIEEECHRAERHQSEFTVLRVRCDRAAQKGLVEQVLASTLRLFDVIASYGPGEYEVLLADTSPKAAETVVARLEANLGKCGARPRMGLACYPRDSRSADGLVLQARPAAAESAKALLTAASTVPTPGSAREASTALPAGDAPAASAAPEGAMAGIYRMLDRVAPSDINVLILGETGVGKERTAEAVHQRSRRKDKPFLCLNCAALTETLLESELFGHEKGAFTGAQSAKEGLLESADGGTVFLDEVGDLPASIQVKLLRVLEERKVRRVGGLKAYSIDVRFVAATNKDLEADVARGSFRQDLFFRLNGIAFVVPPLRERTAEIPGLAERFAADAARRFGRLPAPRLSREVLELLCEYPWPGNIRELRNLIERAVLLCESGPITAEHLPERKMSAQFARRVAETHPAAARPAPAEPLRPARGPVELRQELQACERQRILDALAACAGNQTEAARVLQISRRTLVKRLTEFQIPRPRKRG